MPWSRAFEDPIALPNGRQILTLQEAADYIMKLPNAEHDADAWQAATEALTQVAEQDGSKMFARTGMMRAINAGKPNPATTPRRKRAIIYQIIR